MSYSYYERFIPEALIRELKIRVETRIADELFPLAKEIIADEIAKSHLNLVEWVSSQYLDKQVSIVVTNHETIS